MNLNRPERAVLSSIMGFNATSLTRRRDVCLRISRVLEQCALTERTAFTTQWRPPTSKSLFRHNLECHSRRKKAGKQKHAIMLSSTYKELAEHRQAVREAILGQELFPEAMENDAALPDHDLISASLEKVDKADAYVELIGYRYGQTPECSARNPDNLSLTELEFRRALERKIPICMFSCTKIIPLPCERSTR